VLTACTCRVPMANNTALVTFSLISLLTLMAGVALG